MSESNSFEFIAPELLHLRPLTLVAKFAKSTEYTNKWVTLSLSNSGKKVKATSVVALALLGIQKGHTFSLEIEGGNPEQIEQIVQSFRESVIKKLWANHLHTPRKELTVPSWIKVRKDGEKHPDHDKYQERYDFLIRAKKHIEENKLFFSDPSSLPKEEYDKIDEKISEMSTELELILKKFRKNSGSLWYFFSLFESNPTRSPKVQELDTYEFNISTSLIDTQRYTGTLPADVLQSIYHNLNIVVDLQSKLDTFDNATSIKEACSIALESMLIGDKAGVYEYMGHEILSNHMGYKNDIANLWKNSSTIEEAFWKYKVKIQRSMKMIIRETQEFLYPQN